MTIGAVLLGESTVDLWELDATERLQRQLRELGVTNVTEDPSRATGWDTVVVLNLAFLFEVKTLRGLLKQQNALLGTADGRIAAAFVEQNHLEAATRAVVTQQTDPELTWLTPDSLDGYDDHLRRTEAPLLIAAHNQNRAELESVLYGNAYKGITDFVTKWWWPGPAKVIVRWCARHRISANQVTVTGLLLMLSATALFAHGWYVAGLLCGWLMTLLDTVDGKLARVTVTSSRVGHVLDHGMDILHPPFWYVYWGLGLTQPPLHAGLAVETMCYAVVAGYVAGRLLEGMFHALGHCSMFAWRPFDAYFRLFTARRNPCMVILSVGVICGSPGAGFLGVVLWTVASTAVLAIRLLQATVIRLTHGPLESWLEQPGAAVEYPRAFAQFSGTRKAYG